MINISCTVPENLQEINAEVSLASDYNLLQNKPSINSVPLVGDVSLADLGVPVYNWELISTADFTGQAVDTVVFSADTSGAPFSLKNYRLVVELKESNGSRWHLKINELQNSRGFYYENAGAVALYRAGQQLIIEPVAGFDTILNITNATPPPTCLYGQSVVPQWLNWYTYNSPVVLAKEDLYPLTKLTLELQTAVTGIIYLYGARV